MALRVSTLPLLRPGFCLDTRLSRDLIVGCDDAWAPLNVNDLLMLLDAWATDPGGPPDFDANGVVDVQDLLRMLTDWPGCEG